MLHYSLPLCDSLIKDIILAHEYREE